MSAQRILYVRLPCWKIYSLEQQMAALRMFKENGHADQKVKLYIPLNAPGETVGTLRDTISKIQDLYDLFGRDNVLPFIFFIGIQPGTPVERLLIRQGYLKADYDPLTLNPFVIKKLLYNPGPLGRLIGRAYLEAIELCAANGDYIGRTTMDIIDRQLSAPDVLARFEKLRGVSIGRRHPGGTMRRRLADGIL